MENQTKSLLQQANELGKKASAKTGVAFTPITPTIPADTLSPQAPIVPVIPPMPRDTKIMSNAQSTPLASSQLEAPVAPVTPPAPSLRQVMEQRLTSQLAGEGAVDKTAISNELRVEEKRKRALDLDNQIIARKTNYERQIEALEANPEGKLAGNLNAQINKLSKEANRELADLSFAYKVANDDYMGAEKVLNDRVADLREQRNWEMQVFNQAFNFLQNDLTESEKIEIQAQNRLREIEYENEIRSTETEGKNTIIDAQVKNYQALLDSGQITIKDVPKDLMGGINTQGYVSPEQKASLDKSKSLLTNINEFLGTKGTTAVGAPVQRIFGAMAGLVGIGTYNQRKQQVENIQSLLTLDNLKLMTGVLTDRDIQLLSSAASTLTPSMSEKAYRKELGKISSSIESKLIASPAVPFEEKVGILTTKIKREYPNATPDEIADLIDEQLPEQQAFNSAGNASVSSLASAIKTVESGGNYQARGPVVTSGQYKGERALGAYQIMPGNLPSWSKEALGYEVTPEQFLANPKIQDAIALSRFDNLLKKYPPQDAAAIWFSGQPLANNDAKDVTGTNVRTYVDRVIKNLS